MSVLDHIVLDEARYDLQDTDGRAMIAPTEASTTASAAHEAGSYFVYGGTLYQATADIAQGGTIITSGSGQNCKVVTVAGEVSDLKSALYTTNILAGIPNFPMEITQSTDLLTLEDAKPGDVVTYHFFAQTGKTGFLDILNTNGTRITYIGKGSSSSGALDYSGTYTLPSNFGKIVGSTNGVLTLDILYVKTIKGLIEETNQRITSVESNTENEFALVNLALYKKDKKKNDVLFTNSEAPYGSIIRYSLIADEYYATQLELYDANNVRISAYGKTSARHDGEQKTYTGEFTIPFGFDKCIFYPALTIAYRINYIIIDPPKYAPMYPDIKLTPFIDNRLPNPHFTTRQKEEITPTYFTGYIYRIPTVIVSNSKTVLVAMTNQQSGGDSGWSEIHLKRKPNGGDWGDIVIVMPKDDLTTTRYLNPSFTIDRTGAHGPAGRIYLFAGEMKSYTKLWSELNTNEIDIVYKYSDDDGVTWSDFASLKSVFDTSLYTGVIPAPDNGIQMADGTLAIPCMLYGASGGNFRDSILYKTANGNWEMTNITPYPGYSVSECSAIEMPDGKLALLSRKDVNYSDSAPGEDLFIYDFASDTFTHVESSFYRNNSCKSSVAKATINGKTLYLKTYIDTDDTTRKNITVWASKDCMKWIRCYRLYTQPTRGYGSISAYDGIIAAVYEGSANEGGSSNLQIGYQDLSSKAALFTDCLVYLQSAPTYSDILQAMFNKLAGIT